MASLDDLQGQHPSDSGLRPETTDYLNALTGVGTQAYLAMRDPDLPEYEDWRDSNFASDDSGNYVSREGQSYTDDQLEHMHRFLSRQAGNPFVSGLFDGPDSPIADYMVWRNQNFSNDHGAWEDEDGNLYSEAALQRIFADKSAPQFGRGSQSDELASSGADQDAQDQSPAQPTNEPPVIDTTAMANLASRIPKQSSAPPMAPPLAIALDEAQQRKQLKTLMTGINTPATTPYREGPDGRLILNVGPQVNAPSRIQGQYARGDYFSDVDIALIKGSEGGTILHGYVPPPDKKGRDNSGVTIAAGFDLGQHSVQDLRNLGLPNDLVNRFTKYLQLTGDDAREAVRVTPLRINGDEAALINRAAFRSYPNDAGAAFNKARADLAGNRHPADADLDPQDRPAEFARLPWQAQTVIADLWYNLGDLRAKAPQLWKQVTTGDWEGAYHNLRTFSSGDQTLAKRAKRDAKLLMDAMEVGTLPD